MIPAPPRPPSDIQALADALRRALLRLSRKLRRESQALGLSPLDAMLLGAVRKKPGVGVSELADVERMSRPSMSAHVKRLEASAWLARQAPDIDDRRRVGLILTPAGVKALDAIRRRRHDWLAKELSALSPDARASLAGAIGALEQIADDLT
jgi:DNA-binding MarR family transcriptional regulator